MRFLIIGAGALGGYYGGMLLKGGGDVTFLVRPQRAAQLAERGLVVRTREGEFRSPVKTVQAGAAGGPFDVAILTCKAYDLDAAIDDFAPALAADGAVLPVLNGVNHIDVLSARLGAGRVLGGVTQFSVVRNAEGEITVPGVGVLQTVFGELSGERSPRCEAIAAALAAGGVAVTVSDNILGAMWEKFAGLAASAAYHTLTRGRARDIARAPAGARFVVAAADETARIAVAEGFRESPTLRDAYLRAVAQRDSDAAPSILYDMENGRPTEGEHVVGDMVRRAERHGIEAPIMLAALCNLQIYEARRRARFD